MHRQMHQCAMKCLPTEGHGLADHCFVWPLTALQQRSILLVLLSSWSVVQLLSAQSSDHGKAGHIWAACSPSQMVSYTINLSVLAAVRFHRAPQNEETDEEIYG